VHDVVNVLGGIAAVAAMTGCRPKSVSAWQAQYGSFPAKTYVVMTVALATRGFTAPAALWRQVGCEGVTLVPGDAAVFETVRPAPFPVPGRW
jgi:hypothetical protein